MRLNLEVDTTRRAIEHFPARSSESAPGGALPDPEGAAEISPVSARTRWLRGATLPRGSGWAFAVCLALILALTYCSRLGLGLWEDGYFVKRFAYNYWHHGTFSWNVVDGPVYGMTSQTLQWLGTVLYVLAPDYVVSSIKAACCAALFATLLVMVAFTRREYTGAAVPRGDALFTGLPCLVGLSSAAVIEASFTGLETPLGLLAVAVSLGVVFGPFSRWRAALAGAACLWLVYLTRPDAVMIPISLLGGRALLSLLETRQRGWRAPGSELPALAAALLLGALGLGVTLLALQHYYGTALPLPFYEKTRGLNMQDPAYVAIFASEKTKNVVQVLFLALPFVYVAAHDRRRNVLLLLAAGFSFGAYHYVATIETMGYFSRFYQPGLIPIFAAAGIAYPAYRRKRRFWLSVALYAAIVAAFIWLKHVDNTYAIPIKLRAAMYVPPLVVVGLLLIAPTRWAPLGALSVVVTLLVGTLLNSPLQELRLETDEVILLRQIQKRIAFRGLERLRDRLNPATVYHTDMGAPGILLPEARVVDLDGLLNEDITLRGKSFRDLCEADHPEAIYLPKPVYVQLRDDILSSRCFDDYQPVTPEEGARLYIRQDLVQRYLEP